MLNITNIPAPRVDFIDARTGLMSREWYRFFLNLFVLTGTGQSNLSLEDLQKDPDATTYVANIEKMLDDLRQQVDTATLSNNDELNHLIRVITQKLDTLPQPQLGTMAAVEQDNVRFVGYSLEPSPPVVYSPGVSAWNQDDGTLDIGLYGDSVLQVGQETLFYAKNTSGSLIPIGTPVMFTGTVGASGKLTFGLAVADGSAPADYMMGVTAQNVTNNDFGYVTSFGLVRGFNTTGTLYGESWVDGDLLYFGAAAPGTWTKVKPVAPRIDVPVAVVVNAGSGGSGSIFVRMTVAEALSRLQDVYINGTGTPNNGDILIYDSADLRWENKAQTDIVAGQANNLTGGVAGSIPYQSAVNTTAMLPIGAANTVLTSTGAAPQWSTGLALSSATSITANSVAPALQVTQTGAGVALNVIGSADFTSLVATTADINGGTIDGTTIGASTASTGRFSDLTDTGLTSGRVIYAGAGGNLIDSTNLTFDGAILTSTGFSGPLNGTVGATTPNTGVFTTASATTGNITTVNATTVDTTNLEVTTLKAKDGTTAGSIADSTGVVTLASSVLTTTDINGGTIDGTTIGGASAAAGTFTTLTSTGDTTLGDAAADTITSNGYLSAAAGLEISKTAVTAPAASDGNVYSGTYTPTVTAVTNVSAVSASINQYMRVGNVITVSGRVRIDPVVVGNTVIGMTLPVASNFTDTLQLAGTFATTRGANVDQGAIFADATNDRANFQFNAIDTALTFYVFQFTYRIL